MVGSVTNTNGLFFLGILSIASLYLLICIIYDKIKGNENNLELFPIIFIFLFSTILGVMSLLLIK